MTVSNLWKKAIRCCYRLLYSLPFAMKAGNELIATNNGASTTINQHKQRKSVWQDIKDVKLTEEVQALRWKTFKAEEKSNEYEYLGNGVADKREGKYKDGAVWNLYKFRQPNIELDYGYDEALDAYVDNGIANLPKRTLITAEYYSIQKFRIEKYIESVFVNINDEERKYRFSLSFPIHEHGMDITERQFKQYIKKMYDEWECIKDNASISARNYFFEKYGTFNELSRIKFTTYRASNNVPNGVTYDFRAIDILDLEKEGDYIIMNFIAYNFEGARLLSEQFKAPQEVIDKYDRKEKRENIEIKMGNNEAYCEECGEPMNYYDHHILLESGFRALCQKCLTKEKVNNC